jgi:hypothetical protein
VGPANKSYSNLLRLDSLQIEDAITFRRALEPTQITYPYNQMPLSDILVSVA